MSKYIIALLLIILPVLSFAEKSSFYLGAGIGADTTDFIVDSYPQIPGDFKVTNKTQLAAEGVMGNILGGYSWVHDWFYLAGEIDGNLSSAKITTSNNEQIHHTISKTTDQMDGAWGVSLLPGVVFQENTVFYSRVGYTNGHYLVKTSDTSLKNIDTWLNGLRLGLGIKRNVSKNWDVRFEYDHVSYEQESSTVYLPTSNFTKKSNVTPHSNQFVFDVIYRFSSDV